MSVLVGVCAWTCQVRSQPSLTGGWNGQHRRRDCETVIGRPAGEVFDFVADERNEPKYNPRMLRADKVTRGPIGRGTRFLATATSLGRPVDMLVEVTTYDRPTRFGTTTNTSTAEI